ncbi:hypothetical protein MY10362_007662 [Beauveria mimosiformis]
MNPSSAPGAVIASAVGIGGNHHVLRAKGRGAVSGAGDDDEKADAGALEAAGFGGEVCKGLKKRLRAHVECLSWTGLVDIIYNEFLPCKDGV